MQPFGVVPMPLPYEDVEMVIQTGELDGVATLVGLLLWGKGAYEMPFNVRLPLLNGYPLLTLPLFIYMGCMFSESGIASALYHMFHVRMGPINGGLAIGTMGLMVAVSAMNGLGEVHAIKSLLFERWGRSPFGVHVMMPLPYIRMGMFLDDTAMLIIVAPLYVPLVIRRGYNPIWYGVLCTITCQIANMTPPFGDNRFLMKAWPPRKSPWGISAAPSCPSCWSWSWGWAS